MTRFPRFGDNFITQDLPEELRCASPAAIAEWYAKMRTPRRPDPQPRADSVTPFRPRAPITRGIE